MLTTISTIIKKYIRIKTQIFIPKRLSSVSLPILSERLHRGLGACAKISTFTVLSSWWGSKNASYHITAEA